MWLRGRCVDEAGAPLAGVAVELGAHVNEEALFHWLRDHPTPDVTPVTLVTGADGRFEFAAQPLPPVSYELAFRARDRVVMEARWYEGADGRDHELGDVVVARGVTVTGRVVDRAGAPQAGVALELELRSDLEVWPSDPAPVTTRADGTFELAERCHAGHYTIRVDERRIVGPGTVDLAATPVVQHVELVVEPVTVPMALAGVVVDEAGTGVAGALL